MASKEDCCSQESKATNHSGSSTALLDTGAAAAAEQVAVVSADAGSETVPAGLNEQEGVFPELKAVRKRLGTKSHGGHSWRKSWLKAHRASRRRALRMSNSTAAVSQSNSLPPSGTESSRTASSFGGLSSYFAPVDTNASADDLVQPVGSPSTAQSDAATTEAAPSDPSAAEAVSFNQTEEQPQKKEEPTATNEMETPFTNLDVAAAAHPDLADNKAQLANVIEKAILDFCSSRTVETMRRMFAGVTSELEAMQGDAGRSGDKSASAPHPVTGDLVKEGIVIGSMDVFAPRVHKEYKLEMKDSLVEGFLKDVGVFRSICYRTKCQIEVTRRLLNKKLCTGGRWVKYLIVRIVGPSLRAISCCDSLLQKAVPAFKNRIEYPKAAFCRMFFREDIPDNALLYNCYQRTGGTSNRYGSLKLETPYRVTSERTVGSCPWKNGALRIGKLSFAGSGAHLCMRQVYPGYGYTDSTPVGAECKGVEALHRIEKMHGEFLSKRQQILMDRRTMTLPVCR